MTPSQIAYLEYLQSPEWKAIKGKVLRRDGYLCQLCKRNPAVEVHHLTYERRGHERLDDLTAVCRQCHKERHGR